MTQGTVYPDGLFFLSNPLYLGFGNIHGFEDGFVIGDFTEKMALEIRSDIYQQLIGVAPTGGSRSLKGMSGSGLWFRNGADLILAGTLLGPYPIDPDKRRGDQQLIRFTPIWQTLKWLDDNWNKWKPRSAST